VIYCINPWCKARENDDQAETCSACNSPLLINGRFKVLNTLYALERSHDVDIYEALDTIGSYEGRGVNTIKILKVLKAYDERFIEIFKQEARILQSLDHQAIPFVDIEDYFCVHLDRGPDDLYCLAMSKIEGITLSAWVKEHGQISQDLAITWLQQLCEVLDYVHSHSVIHRDIKPENIIVRPDKSLALVDFGFSQSITDYSRTGNRPKGSVYGVRSFGYTAPEQNIGRSYPQSDIYSLGRTLIFALTGKSCAEIPSNEQSSRLLWHDHAKQITKPFRQLIDRLTAHSIAKRPQDAYEILCFLEDVLPEQIKWSRRWRSKPYRYGAIFLLAIVTILLLNLGRLGLSNFYYEQGYNQANNAEYDIARQSLQRSAWFNDNESAHRAMALMCTDLGDIDCAKRSYEAATRVDPSNDSPWYNLATFYEDQNDYVKAKETYKKALELKKENPSTLNNLARLYIKWGNYPEAQKFLDSAKSTLSKDKLSENLLTAAIMHKNQGWLFFKQKKYTKSKLELTASIEKNPNLVSPYCLLAQVNEALKLSSNEDWKKCVFPNENNITRPQDETLPEVYEWRYLRFNQRS
jgi:serine/threonine protein kinase